MAVVVQDDERLLALGYEAGTAPEDRTFRPDIEGLRAVAVALVVLFHGNLGHVRGGFIGVDVFFVISGFVITGVLLREHSSGFGPRRQLLEFYARRCRRIIPAATVVLLAAVVASYLVLGVVTGDSTAIDAKWAAVFLANLHFAANGTNYLTAQQPPSPVQNFWSLAVEEQFYLVYPALFLIAANLRRWASLRIRLATGLVAVIVVSFIWSIVQTSSDPTAAFFSPLTRAWELALGALVAVSTQWLKRLPAPMGAALSWVGLTAIIGAGFGFTSAMAYPGWWPSRSSAPRW